MIDISWFPHTRQLYQCLCVVRWGGRLGAGPDRRVPRHAGGGRRTATDQARIGHTPVNGAIG